MGSLMDFGVGVISVLFASGIVFGLIYVTAWAAEYVPEPFHTHLARSLSKLGPFTEWSPAIVAMMLFAVALGTLVSTWKKKRGVRLR